MLLVAKTMVVAAGTADVEDDDDDDNADDDDDDDIWVEYINQYLFCKMKTVQESTSSISLIEYTELL